MVPGLAWGTFRASVRPGRVHPCWCRPQVPGGSDRAQRGSVPLCPIRILNNSPMSNSVSARTRQSGACKKRGLHITHRTLTSQAGRVVRCQLLRCASSKRSMTSSQQLKLRRMRSIESCTGGDSRRTSQAPDPAVLCPSLAGQPGSALPGQNGEEDSLRSRKRVVLLVRLLVRGFTSSQVLARLNRRSAYGIREPLAAHVAMFGASVVSGQLLEYIKGRLYVSSSKLISIRKCGVGYMPGPFQDH